MAQSVESQPAALSAALKLIQEGRPEEAIPSLVKAVADPGLTAGAASEAHYLLGAAYFQSGQYKNVAAELRRLEAGVHAERVLFMLEESARLTHDGALARQAFHELNQRFPESPWLHFLMGAAYESQSDNEHAIAEYKAGLAKDARLPNANFAIGYIYWKDRAFADAKPWFTKELDIQPCHALAAYYLADASQALGNKPEALKLYKLSIACNGRNEKAHLGLGILLADMHQDQEAIDELRTAARLDANDATPHYRLALLYRKLGRKADAAAEYQRVQQIHDAGRKQAEESLKDSR